MEPNPALIDYLKVRRSIRLFRCVRPDRTGGDRGYPQTRRARAGSRQDRAVALHRLHGRHPREIGEKLLEMALERDPNLSGRNDPGGAQPLHPRPVVIGVISTAGPHAKIPEWEQVMSAGAVCLNVLMAACPWLCRKLAFRMVRLR